MATIKTQLMTALQRKFPENEFRHKDIIRTLIEDIKGREFDPIADRGYYSTNLSLSTNGYLRFSSKRESRHLVKNSNGTWSVKGDAKDYPIVTFVKRATREICTGRLMSTDANGHGRIQLLTGGAPIFVLVGTFSESREEIVEMTKAEIERKHGHSYREYIRLMKEIGENL